MMTKYDSYGRPISTGFFTSASTPTANNDATTYTKQITSTTYGTTGIEKGKVMQSKSLILGNYVNGTTWLETNNFYDNYGRLRYATGNNHLNTALDAQNNYYSYDFADHVLTDTTKHKPNAGTTYTIINRNTFDYLGRSISSYNKIDANAEKHISTNLYNYRGELVTKGLSQDNVAGIGLRYLQKTDFTYNTQGWLTDINGPLASGQYNGSNEDQMDVFYLKLNYDSGLTSVNGQSLTLDKSGNISQMLWQDRGGSQKGYFFDYDFLSRVSNSKYFDVPNGTSVGIYNGYYNEFLTYDLRGNINTLARYTYDSNSDGNIAIDNLNYTYAANSNVLSKIADGSGSSQGFNLNGASGSANYLYDLNGSMYKDPYKKLDFITYYYNNMPKDITVNLGTGNVNKIRFTYDASGMKLRKQVFNNANTSTALQDYVRGVEYNNGTIEAIYHSAGRAVWNGSAWRYEFNVTDHLGNVRAVISDLDNDKILDFTGSSTTNEVINSYTYYPFGMVFGNNTPANNTVTPDTKYQYNGKEFNSDLGLNLLDYGARLYDPAVGRFTGVDPLAEKFAWVNTYNYAENEPIANIDLWGLQKVSVKANIKQGGYGADFRLLGAKAGVIANLDARNLLGVEGSVNFKNLTTDKKLNYAEDSHEIGISGGALIGGEITSNNDEKIKTTTTELKVEAGFVNHKYQKTTVKGAKPKFVESVGISLGAEIGLGVIGFEIELNLDFEQSYKQVDTPETEQSVMQRDNTSINIVVPPIPSTSSPNTTIKKG